MKIVYNEYFYLSLIFIFGAYFRFKGLTHQSLWLDELMSVAQSNPDLSFGEVIAFLKSDPHPPMFYLSLHYWMLIFGYTEFAARFFVALIGSLSVVSVYWLGKECLNKKVGLIASLLAAVNFFNLRFSQEVRPYILLFLFAALSYTFFIRLIREQNRKNVILYSVFTALLLYSHYYGMIHLLCQIIFLLYYAVFEKKIPYKNLLKHFSISGALIVVLYSPWIPMTLKMMGKSKHWTTRPRPDFFTRLFNNFFGSEPFQVFLFGGLLLVLLFFFISLRKQESSVSSPASSLSLETNEPSKDMDTYMKLYLALPVLFTWVFFSLFIPYYRSLTVVPMYVDKYGIGILPAVLVMVAISITLFKSNLFKALLVSGILMISLTNTIAHKKFYKNHWKTDWRGVAQYVVENSGKYKYRGKEIYILAAQPKLYQFYFHSLNPDLEETKSLPIKRPALKSAIKKMLAGNKDFGVWYLPGFNYKPDKKVLEFLDRHFIKAETKKLKMGRASFYIPKQEKNKTTSSRIKQPD